MKEDLRVPTVSMTAEVTLDDGKILTGRVFLPAMASRHPGQPRPDEWINQPSGFFPFLIDGEENALILNKATVAALSFSATPELSVDRNMGFTAAVEVTWAGGQVEGLLLIDMPAERTRVLDYLNHTGQFIPLWTSQTYYLIRRDCITGIVEREG